MYEETLFRLILVPVLFGTLRLLQAPQVLASTLAVTGSALLFALAHHAGSPGEAFTWFAFVFRWMAGVFFAWVFVLARLRDCRRHAHHLRHPRRLDCLASLNWLCVRARTARQVGTLSAPGQARRNPSKDGSRPAEPAHHREGGRCVSFISPTSISGGMSFTRCRLFSKRLLGMSSLVLGRARRFRLERVPELVEQVRSLDPDHILITGDMTTTALPAEFRAARAALKDWLDDPARVTIVPGNHDRYTFRAHRSRRFEEYFGDFSPAGPYPWLRMLEEGTAILGLDPTRAGISARGKLPASPVDSVLKR